MIIDNEDRAKHIYEEKYFKSSFTFDPRRNMVWSEVCRYLQKKFIPPDSRILDLGAGYCSFINNIRGSEKHAVDLFAELTEHAAKEVITHIGPCTNLDFFDDNSFDLVFASNLLEHLPNDALFNTLTEVRRILKAGGSIMCLQPNFRLCYRTYFDDYTHVQIFTDRSLSEFLNSFDFNVTHVLSRFLPVNMKSKLRFNIPMLRSIIRCYLNSPVKPFAGQMLIVARKTGKPTNRTGKTLQ